MANTIFHDNTVRECDDIEEMLTVAKSILQTHENWKHFFNEELGKRGLTVNKFGRICGVSYNTVKKWSEGTLPKTRDNFIKIGLALRYSVLEINRLLNRYGKYSALYPKAWEDAVCMFIINNYKSDTSVNLVKKYEELKSKYSMVVKGVEEPYNPAANKNGTAAVLRALEKSKDEEEFDEFMKSHIPSFADSHGKLIKFIDNFIAAVDERNELQIIGEKSKDYKNKNIFKKDQDVTVRSGYRRNRRFRTVCDTQLSKLRNHRELPTRKNLVILGIYLNMGLEEVNILLNLANMEPLCPKDTVECMLIYALMTVDVNHPEYMVEHAIKLRDSGNQEWKNYCDHFLKYYESRYTKADYDKQIDAIESSVADYVADVLLMISEEEPSYKEYLEEYADLLIRDDPYSDDVSLEL